MARHPLIAAALALLLAAGVRAADFDLGAASNRVGLDLWRQLESASPGQNLALSPYSIESALALAYAGADGRTRTEMTQVLGFPPDDPPLEAAFASLKGSLDQIAEDSVEREKVLEREGGHGDVIEWHLANRIFGQQGYPFRASFLSELDAGYGAPLEPADFRNHAEDERLRINAWVAGQTRDRIEDLIPSGGVTADTRMTLVDALYLKAPWESPFNTDATESLPFHPAGGDAVQVPTMRMEEHLGYLKGNGFTAVALSYKGGSLQLLVLLPDDRDGLARMMSGLTPAVLRSCANLDSRLVDLQFPKLLLEGRTISLSGALEALGMKTAFDVPAGSADFGRAAPRTPGDYLALSEVFHKTYLAIDEHGTEAAAATAAVMFDAMAAQEVPEQPVAVHVDHPFFFAIQHRATGACLFLGTVSDPR